MRDKKIKFWSAAALALVLQITASSQPLLAAFYDGFPSIEESKAYEQYKMRPASEHSKLFFLIDRFTDSEIEIVYDGHYYSAAFVGRVTRWFLSRHYKKEEAEKWIMRWCNTSVISGNLIWAKLPNEKFRLAREVLLEELKALKDLEEAEKEAQSKKKETFSKGSTRDSELEAPALSRLVAGSPKAS